MEKITSDDSCERIEWLISKVLKKIATDKSGWEMLYKDPKDNRLWLMYFPQGEMQAGGPPSLRLIIKDEVKLKFNAS